MAIYQLDKNATHFPAHLPLPGRIGGGLVAVGGNLTPSFLVSAYVRGVFPWTDFRTIEKDESVEKTIFNQMRWYCPSRRFVIFPDEVHISHSMRNVINKGIYKVTHNQSFERVITGCSMLRIFEEGAWLGEDMVKAYTELHRLGVAHSFEVWEGDSLVGGLYGLLINGVFFGESMFSLKPNASKLALIELCRYMKQNSFKMIDCQFETPHLKSMGGRHISYFEYIKIINDKHQ